MEDLQQRLNELRQNYILSLPDKAKAIDDLWKTLLIGDWEQDKMDTMHRLVHNLAGSGATYGIMDISQLARELLNSLRPKLTEDGVFNTYQEMQVTTLVFDLKARINSLDREVGSIQFGVVNQSENVFEKTTESLEVDLDTQRPRIFLVEDDPDQAQMLMTMFEQIGYQVVAFLHLEALPEAIKNEMPAALVVDLGFPEGELAGAETIIKIQEMCEDKLPIIFTSARDDIEARLMAVRAGGTHFFRKPINIPHLADALHNLTGLQAVESYRILLVDDDAAVTEYYSLLLQMKGITAKIVSDPYKTLETIAAFKPDLIVMDLNMPGCSGAELGTLIRQHERYAKTPIVYFSQESDFDMRLKALQLGGDDYFNKSTHPEWLVQAINSRVRRMKTYATSQHARIWSGSVQPFS